MSGEVTGGTSAGSTSTNSGNIQVVDMGRGNPVGISLPEGSTSQGENQSEGQAQTFENFEQWIAAQQDDVQGLFESHVSGLKAALNSERENRKSLQKAVKDLQATAGTAEDLQARLTQLESQLAEQGNYARFVEAAAAANVKNLRLAWLAVKEYNLLDSRGDVDLEELKGRVPELFARPASIISAGAGAGAPPATTPNMNDLIRSAAGRSR